ncbi:MAG: MBL fold metallo-hydrolase, partial [Alphaproteobacteria bacterium]|nr:MBL fold metallo-hydrolase [Alphaproteobacteria bacterium]
MIFRQLFDTTSSTYTYLIASRAGGEALLIDPVFEKTDRYLKLLEELDLRLVKVVDTHVHADHVTAMGILRDTTNCITVMGEQSSVDIVSMRVADGERVRIEGIELTAMYTPGHTDDSYSFSMDDRVFTGDTLLIRGTGRTDFQNGDAARQYDSIFNTLLKLPDNMLVYPAHDYKGDMVSTIAEERANNPRLQVSSRDEYIDLMNNLNLPNPKMMDVAVPENQKMGITLDRQREVPTLEAKTLQEQGENYLVVDLREKGERDKSGIIPGSVHAPFSYVDQHLPMLQQTGKPIVF